MAGPPRRRTPVSGRVGCWSGMVVFIGVAKQQHKPAMMVRVYSCRNNCLRARLTGPYDYARGPGALSARAAVHSARPAQFARGLGPYCTDECRLMARRTPGAREVAHAPACARAPYSHVDARGSACVQAAVIVTGLGGAAAPAHAGPGTLVSAPRHMVDVARSPTRTSSARRRWRARQNPGDAPQTSLPLVLTGIMAG